mmetsp:Transcript_22931/g.32875  ORF Transcript_22931/g.32875 Transcript_22931/m.32875 type:complete len:244 (-) Transcript_22931:929-1660(-)
MMDDTRFPLNGIGIVSRPFIGPAMASSNKRKEFAHTAKYEAATMTFHGNEKASNIAWGSPVRLEETYTEKKSPETAAVSNRMRRHGGALGGILKTPMRPVIVINQLETCICRRVMGELWHVMSKIRGIPLTSLPGANRGSSVIRKTPKTKIQAVECILTGCFFGRLLTTNSWYTSLNVSCPRDSIGDFFLYAVFSSSVAWSLIAESCTELRKLSRSSCHATDVCEAATEIARGLSNTRASSPK